MIEDKRVEERGVLYTSERELEPDDLNPVIYKPLTPKMETKVVSPESPLVSAGGSQVLQFATQNQMRVVNVKTIVLQPSVILSPVAPIPPQLVRPCCKVHSIYYRNDFTTNIVVLGHNVWYCGLLNCENDPCINYRVKRKYLRYMDAFISLQKASGGPLDIYCDISPVNNREVIKRDFKSYLMLNCHDHVRTFGAIPRKNAGDLSIYKKVHMSDFQTIFLIEALKLHVVLRKNQTVKNFGFGKKQILRRKIDEYKPPKLYETIDGHYAQFYVKGDLGGTVKKPVVRMHKEDIIWDVHPILANGVEDMTKWIQISGPVLFNEYKQRIEELWNLNFE
jgi:hypothetical protein